MCFFCRPQAKNTFIYNQSRGLCKPERVSERVEKQMQAAERFRFTPSIGSALACLHTLYTICKLRGGDAYSYFLRKDYTLGRI